MSTRVEVCGLRRSYAGTDALRDVSADFAAGSLVAVLGPSGCGKTTLLRLIAGLEPPDAGEVLFDGHLRTDRSRVRPTAMVFQSESLFPDMTVAENIGFGQRVRGRRGPAATERIAVAMLRLGLAGLEDRYPDQLSGGEQRRVAIARALAAEPGVLLLDEPLAGLDEQLARTALAQIRSTQRRLGLTTVLVTHDQEHALLVADTVIVMASGRILQAGAPREVFERPASVFVAEFLGRSSFVDAQPLAILPGRPRRARVDLFGRLHDLPAHESVREGAAATVMIRPHALSGVSAPVVEPRGRGWWEVTGDGGVVQETHYYGDRIEYVVETESGLLVGTGSLDGELLAPLATVRVVLNTDRAWLLPR
ncbi:MAG: ABC transporter ATP-binding protein [Propionibacteriaceae bacterium]|nr:ABC transporter ATP-binding protein [Propionibacteriaceae bacterium]